MDLNEFSPAPGRSGLPDPALRELADALRNLRMEPHSISQMAGTFSAPQQYNYDQNFEQARATAEARRAARPSFQPMEFAAPDRMERVSSAIDKLNPEKPEVNVYVERQQQAAPRGTTQVPQPQQTRQRTARTPAPQPQPVPQPQPTTPQLPVGQGGAVAGHVAQGVLGAYNGPAPVQASPYDFRGMPGLGKPASMQTQPQFEPLRPPAQPPVSSPAPAREGGGLGTSIPVTPDVRPARGGTGQEIMVRPAPKNVSLLRPGAVSTTPAPGTVLGGQFEQRDGEAV